jgi:hypothetical protein
MRWHWSRFFSDFFGFPLLLVISPLLHTHLSQPHKVCSRPDQAAHYHTLGPKLRASSLTWHLDDLEVKVVLFLLFMQFLFPGLAVCTFQSPL